MFTSMVKTLIGAEAVLAGNMYQLSRRNPREALHHGNDAAHKGGRSA